MKGSRIALLVAVLALATGCPVVVVPGRPAVCEEACQRLGELGCEDGMPLPDGTSCSEFCGKTEAAGHDLATACVAMARSCEEAEACR